MNEMNENEKKENEKTWNICPWSQRVAVECESGSEKWTEQMTLDHITWHLNEEVRMGYMIRHDSGRFSLVTKDE